VEGVGYEGASGGVRRHFGTLVLEDQRLIGPRDRLLLVQQ